MADTQRSVQTILIVGGGSAGWITANLLNAYLNVEGTSRVKITVLESPNIPSVGVGEATVPTIRNTLTKMGIGEEDFMRSTQATFKSSIRFHDWRPGGEFDHPFDRRSREQTNNALQAWLALGRDGKDFAKQFSLLSHVCDHNLAPKGVGWPDYKSAFPYAYHLDAVKLAHLLTETGLRRGIEHRLATVEAVNLTETGEIESVRTDLGEVLSADLYIDCTGFRARLISEIEPQIHDYSETLLCDRAVTLQVPYEVYEPAEVRPYTSATARSAGWNWDINLQDRRGVGYVYSSAFLSDEDALEELQTFEGPHACELNARQISFKTFKRHRSWAGNCIAIGLSDCFMEPLESSGLFMIDFSAHLVGELLSHRLGYTPATAGQFNRVTKSLAEEVLDFVSLHYLTSARTDTEFWRRASDPARATTRLRDLLEEWKTRPLNDTDLLSFNRLFSFESYEFLLYGSGYCRPPAPTPLPVFTHDISAQVQNCFDKLPPHSVWLEHFKP